MTCKTKKTQRVSVSSDGTQASNNIFGSAYPSISEDGRYVAFSSEADNLVLNDTNKKGDVFVHDRQTGETKRVSVSSDGAQASFYSEGNTHTSITSISADGRFIAFDSDAINLVKDVSGVNVFVHDMQTGKTELISISSEGVQGDSWSYTPSISANGRFVTFESLADNLVPGDTNNQYDVFIHDRQTGETKRVSVSSDGEEANNYCFNSSISADGRFVGFSSLANNLVSGDTNDSYDAFIHDMQTGKTERVSISSDGSQGNLGSSCPFISTDCRFVAFQSKASNLVSGDTNEWMMFSFMIGRQERQNVYLYQPMEERVIVTAIDHP